MFGSCRMCYAPTDKWQDFCNECATRDVKPPTRAPRPFLIKGGKKDAAARPEERRSQSKLTLVRPRRGQTPEV